MFKKNKYYSLKNILKMNAVYNVIIGGRSNGKTYACHDYAINEYWKHGRQCALIRRYRDDFIGKRGVVMFDAQTASGNIAKITDGLWNEVYFYRSAWYLARHDENGELIHDERPFCIAFSLASMEHDKSTSFPGIGTIIFDEFITRTLYLKDEFVLFMNVLSTIIRHRSDVRIFMIGNTVNKYCPYFKEMGLTHIKEMKPGDIDLYTYGESKLTVAVEYSENNAGSENNMYFAFDNPKLNMITGSEWEIDLYPHCPVKFKPKEIVFTYFIKFEVDLLQCEIINTSSMMFTFIHRKTTPLQFPERDLIYQVEYNPLPNYARRITNPVNEIQRKVWSFYQSDKVFYQDNEIGEIVRNYILWCRR